jgi:hypothetical protein
MWLGESLKLEKLEVSIPMHIGGLSGKSSNLHRRN